MPSRLPASKPTPQPLLPALTNAERARVDVETGQALKALLAHKLAANTQRSYAGALRYWVAWYRAMYDAPLPLTLSPPEAVSESAVLAFIAHHTVSPTADGGLVMDMPPLVRARLQTLGAVGRRYVHTRAAAAEMVGPIALDVPSVGTVKQRVAALASLHTLLGLPSPALSVQVQVTLRVFSKAAAQRARATKRHPKRAITRKEVLRMIAECAGDGIRGIRDAALLEVSFMSGGRRRGELASMRQQDLQATTLDEPVEDVRDGYVWTLERTKGREAETVVGGVAAIGVLGRAAEALDAWLDCLKQAGYSDGPVWRRIRVLKDGVRLLPAAMDEEEIAAVVKRRAAAVGLDPTVIAGHSLRSGAATDAITREGDARAAAAMALHTNEATTRKFYDRSGPDLEVVARHVAGKKRRRS